MTEILSAHQNITVVAQADDGLTAVALAKQYQPDLLTLDIAMPYAQGISVFVEVKRWSPETRIAVFSGITSSTLLRELYDAGAEGIFTKRGAIAEFEAAIPVLLGGGRVISSDAAAIMTEGKDLAELTNRERQVVSCIVNGQTTKEIAAHLGISPKTIENHRSNIMTKLQIGSMSKLLAYAIREGLFDTQTQL